MEELSARSSQQADLQASSKASLHRAKSASQWSELVKQKEEEIKQKNQVIANLQAFCKQKNDYQEKVEHLEAKVSSLEKVIESLQKDMNKREEQVDSFGHRQNNSEKPKKNHTQQKTSYFGVPTDQSREEPGSFQNFENSQFSQEQWSESLGGLMNQVQHQNVMIPQLSFSSPGKQNFMPKEHNSKNRPPTNYAKQKSKQPKIPDSKQYFTYNPTFQGHSNHRKIEEIENKFSKIKGELKSEKRGTEGSIIGQFFRNRKDNEEALKNINEKIEVILNKSGQNTPRMSRNPDHSHFVDDKEVIVSCLDLKLDRLSHPDRSYFEDSFSYNPHDGSIVSYTSRETARSYIPSALTERRSLMASTVLQHELLPWKKASTIQNNDSSMHDMKKSKIIGECSDIADLLRIRKCYGQKPSKNQALNNSLNSSLNSSRVRISKNRSHYSGMDNQSQYSAGMSDRKNTERYSEFAINQIRRRK